jgi:hypothetical protein
MNKYIGARYIPKFEGEWSNLKTYEPLTIVERFGNSYTSKTFVPIGVDIANTIYWSLSGNYNAQVEQYRQDVVTLTNSVNTLSDSVTTINGKLSNVAINLKAYGAVGDGITDDSDSLIDAINDSLVKKARVYIPYGNYRITKTIALPPNVTLIGEESSFTLHEEETGKKYNNKSIITIDTPIGENIPAFTCLYSNTIKNLGFYWKQNIVGITPLDYGYLFASGTDKWGTTIMVDCVFENLMLYNATRGWKQITGGRNTWNNIKADVCKTLIEVDQSRDSNYINNIHVFPFNSTVDTVRINYVNANLDVLCFKNADDMHISNCLFYRPRRGIFCSRDTSDSDNGSWIECDSVSVDGASAESIRLDYPKYASFVNCRFNSDVNANQCIYYVAQTQSKVIIDSCSFWFAKVGVVQSGGKLDISNCTLEGNVSTLVQSGINDICNISGGELFGNDYNNINGIAKLNGEKVSISSSATTYDNLVTTVGNASQFAINVGYGIKILEFTTSSDNGYGLVNIGADGTNNANTVKFRCNGGTYHVPILCKARNADTVTIQIILQSVSSASSLSNIKIYDTRAISISEPSSVTASCRRVK